MSDATTPAHPRKPVVIGLYGVPGSGKTFLLGKLSHELSPDSFAFYKGSDMIDTVAPGGLDAFKLMPEDAKRHWREVAIKTIQDECIQSRKTAIVTGHYMFWESEEEAGNPVITLSDLQVYTHIVYLSTRADLVLQRQENDKTRVRPEMSMEHIETWKIKEIVRLMKHCLKHSILFTLWSGKCDLAILISDLSAHNEEHNFRVAGKLLDMALEDRTTSGTLEKILVLDADRTLTVEDTGMIWWEEYSEYMSLPSTFCPLKALFGSHLGYSYTAFRQATLMYEGAASDEDFDAICHSTAEAVRVYPQFLALLYLVSSQKHTHAIVLTPGLHLVWEKIIPREGLSDFVKVIGAGRIDDDFVVIPEIKAKLVKRLQATHQLELWAFKDSPLDLPMLKEANRAIVVVGEEATRSHHMEGDLQRAIQLDNMSAEQVLIPSSVSPRLDTTVLPTLDLMDPRFLNSLVCRRDDLKVLHATDKPAAMLLQTRMRDASYADPSLREAHFQCGRYLAVEYLSNLIGLEPYTIPHVQGHSTTGFRLAKENNTFIVALMRSGEPMAFGVNEAFPTAEFLHASSAEEVKLNRLQGRSKVILVDSIINSGATIIEFVQHIWTLAPDIRIVIVAGVVQAQAVAVNSRMAALSFDGNLTVVALRLSENKFTGKGGTDTDNRLFNTVNLN